MGGSNTREIRVISVITPINAEVGKTAFNNGGGFAIHEMAFWPRITYGVAVNEQRLARGSVFYSPTPKNPMYQTGFIYLPKDGLCTIRMKFRTRHPSHNQPPVM